MDRDKRAKLREFENELENSDYEKVAQLLHIFDRVLLYNLAAHVIPPEGIKHVINQWEQIAKRAIDLDASKRTMFLESTIQGRRAKMLGEPDGEDLRLHSLKQLQLAKKVVHSNLGELNDDGDDGDIAMES